MLKTGRGEAPRTQPILSLCAHACMHVCCDGLDQSRCRSVGESGELAAPRCAHTEHNTVLVTCVQQCSCHAGIKCRLRRRFHALPFCGLALVAVTAGSIAQQAPQAAAFSRSSLLTLSTHCILWAQRLLFGGPICWCCCRCAISCLALCLALDLHQHWQGAWLCSSFGRCLCRSAARCCWPLHPSASICVR